MIRLPSRSLRKSSEQPGNRVIWLISFTDLMSLMLAFFVLLYSMNEPELERWQGLARALSAAPSTATTPSDEPAVPRSAFNIAYSEPRRAMNLDYLGALLRSQVSANSELAEVRVVREEDRVIIMIPGDALFDANGRAFSVPGQRAVHLLAAVIARIGNRIEVVGHAEGERPGDPAVWERSLTRAVAVSAALREMGYKRELVARTVFVTGEDVSGNGRPRVDIVVRDEVGGRGR